MDAAAAHDYIEARNSKASDMSETQSPPALKPKLKVERPKLYKVILFNDDFTPREFVVKVLQGEFRLSEDQALRVMTTAHRKGVCVVSVYPRDIAESKATRATDAGRALGFPLRFDVEPEE